MKKEYYYLIGGLLAGGLVTYFIAKNQFQSATPSTPELDENGESTSGVIGGGSGKVRKHKLCVASCMGIQDPQLYADCIAACNGLLT